MQGEMVTFFTQYSSIAFIIDTEKFTLYAKEESIINIIIKK